MKVLFKKIFSIAALLSVIALDASSKDCCNVSSCFLPRSQGRDKTRQVVGSVGHTHLYDMESWYENFSVMFEYTRSFRPQHITRCLFGCSLIDDCDCPSRTIKIQGCKVDDRDPKAWLADYFYLPSDFSSTVSFEPRIQNFLVDLDFYLGLDGWKEGLYLRIHGPITHTRWDLNFCESVVETGTCNHPAGYFTPEVLEREKLLDNFGSYASGCAPAAIDPFTFTGKPSGSDFTVNIEVPGVTFQPLKFCRMDKCKRTQTGFADLRFEFGWNFYQNDDYHLGINLQGAAPTGGKQRACFLFDALVGNGNHWELGAGLTAHYIFWRNEEEDKHFGFYLDANVTHLFKATAQRCFDICDKPNSRYMLAAKMTDNVKNNLQGLTNVPLPTRAADLGAGLEVNAFAQFANEYAPVANVSTVDAKVSIGAQADLVAMFNYTARKFSFDIGYNFWGRSCEKIECPEICPDKCDDNCRCPNICDPGQERMWVLKGDAHMFGFVEGSDNTPENTPIALSASQSAATICKGTGGKDKKKFNDTVDRPRAALAADIVFLVAAPELDGSPGNRILTSIQPIFINCDDLNFQKTRGISHKIFAHFNYTCWDRDNWFPYIGLGGFAEFGKNEDSCNSSCSSGTCDICTSDPCPSISPCDDCDPCCPKCIDCALSQWGVWLKGGVSFH